MAANKGFYRKWYGDIADLGELTPGSPSEVLHKTAILRVTDLFFAIDETRVFWWDGTLWNEFTMAPVGP